MYVTAVCVHFYSSSKICRETVMLIKRAWHRRFNMIIAVSLGCICNSLFKTTLISTVYIDFKMLSRQGET